MSDNQSSVDGRNVGQTTAMMAEWAKLKQRNPAAKLICIDLQPNATSAAGERDDVLNIEGFSDAVLAQIAHFAAGGWGRITGSVRSGRNCCKTSPGSRAGLAKTRGTPAELDVSDAGVTRGCGNHFVFIWRSRQTGRVAMVTHHRSRRPGLMLDKLRLEVAERYRQKLSPQTLKQNP